MSKAVRGLYLMMWGCLSCFKTVASCKESSFSFCDSPVNTTSYHHRQPSQSYRHS